MRAVVTERYCRYFTGQPVDRIPDIEFGWWPQTIRRWVDEGLPRNLSIGAAMGDDFTCQFDYLSMGMVSTSHGRAVTETIP